MSKERLRFALSELGGGHWQLFERFCSEFLAVEYSNFRTTANPAGDKGRDGELFALDGHPGTGFQFSVSKDWKAKIRGTVADLEKNGIRYRRLIYCTSRQVGAQADELKEELWARSELTLDIRDIEWFCERAYGSPEREAASNVLADQIVNPIVSARGIAEVAGAPLTTSEAKVALVHLALNAKDRAGDRSLTKTSFDSLVQSVMIDTSSENLLSEAEVVTRVQALMPHGSPQQVEALTHSALERLSKKHGPIKKRTKPYGYHISFAAREAWKDAAAEYVLDQQSLEEDLAAAAYGFSDKLDASEQRLREEARNLRVALEALMLRSGEKFVAAVEAGELSLLSKDEIEEQIHELNPSLTLKASNAAEAIVEVISTPADKTRKHLLRVLDAYTLLAFLQQTPDVQKALSRVFDNAKIWLDTSAILPLIAELLIDDPAIRSQTLLMSAARASGVKFYVTDGVVEELRYHMERCVNYMRKTEGREPEAPFLFAAYMLSGRNEMEFPSWVENFRGHVDPDLDIRDFLHAKFAIGARDLKDETYAADPKLRNAVEDLFRQARTRTPRGRVPRQPEAVEKLIEHDVVNAVGVIQVRGKASAALGHEAWWLTLDKTAFRLGSWLRDRLGNDAASSPVLSPDYLSQLLRLGPMRRNLGSEESGQLPLLIDVTRLESVPSELIDIARQTRIGLAGLEEYRIRREVRDKVHLARTEYRRGTNYARAVEEEVKNNLRVGTPDAE